jgi:hypothetical protein
MTGQTLLDYLVRLYQNNEGSKSWFTRRRFSDFRIIRSFTTVAHTAKSTPERLALARASTDA